MAAAAPSQVREDGAAWQLLLRSAPESERCRSAPGKVLALPHAVGLCYQFYHYRFYQLGPDNSSYRTDQFRAHNLRHSGWPIILKLTSWVRGANPSTFERERVQGLGLGPGVEPRKKRLTNPGSFVPGPLERVRALWAHQIGGPKLNETELQGHLAHKKHPPPRTLQ